jgi:hypothetical protein
MHDFANSAFPRAGAAFSDMHIGLAQAVAGNQAELEARKRQVDELAAKGRHPHPAPAYRRCRAPSPLSNGEISPPRSTRLNRLPANSNASAVAAHSSTWWSRMASARRPGPSGIPVAGLAAVR